MAVRLCLSMCVYVCVRSTVLNQIRLNFDNDQLVSHGIYMAHPHLLDSCQHLPLSRSQPQQCSQNKSSPHLMDTFTNASRFLTVLSNLHMTHTSVIAMAFSPYGHLFHKRLHFLHCPHQLHAAHHLNAIVRGAAGACAQAPVSTARSESMRQLYAAHHLNAIVRGAAGACAQAWQRHSKHERGTSTPPITSMLLYVGQQQESACAQRMRHARRNRKGEAW